MVSMYDASAVGLRPTCMDMQVCRWKVTFLAAADSVAGPCSAMVCTGAGCSLDACSGIMVALQFASGLACIQLGNSDTAYVGSAISQVLAVQIAAA